MSINIITTPSEFQPVFNTAYSLVQSTNIGQSNLSYVFDTYVNIQGSNVYAFRAFLPPRPDTSCLYSPNSIVKPYHFEDKTQNATGWTSSSGVCHFVRVFFGEAYGSPVTIFSGTSTYYTGFTIGGVASYELLSNWNSGNYWTNYRTDNANAKFLTKQPSSVYIRDGERASISFLNAYNATGYTGSDSLSRMRVVAYQISGGSITTDFLNTITPGLTTNGSQVVNHFGCGLWNVNSGQTSNLTVNVATDYKYTVTLMGGSPVLIPVSITQEFKIDTRCTKYQKIRFMFLNSFGCFDYFTAYLLSRKTLDVSRQTVQRVLPYNYTLGARGEDVINLTANKRVTITTDWLTDAEVAWLEELWCSKSVYELRDDGSLLPIIMDMSSIEIKEIVNDKLVNYDISYHYANPRNTMGG